MSKQAVIAATLILALSALLAAPAAALEPKYYAGASYRSITYEEEGYDTADMWAPALQVGFPEEPIDTAIFTLRGETEPDAEVFVGDSRVELDEDGSFTHAVHLQPGFNVVVVEAIDPVGNTSYASSVVHAKVAVRESTP